MTQQTLGAMSKAAAVAGLIIAAVTARPAPAVTVPSAPAHRTSALAGVAAKCSAKEPFNPPVVATLTPGLLAYDARLGLAIVVSTANRGSGAVTITEYSASTGRVVRSRPVTSTAHSAAASAYGESESMALDGTTGRLFVLHQPFAAVHAPSGRVDVVDVSTLSLRRSVVVGGVALPPAVDERSGRVFVANQQDGTMSVLDAATGQRTAVVRVARTALGPSPPPLIDEGAGRVLFAENTRPGRVVFLDARSGTVLHSVTVGAAPEAIAIDARNGHALVANQDSNSISVLDVRRGSLLRTVDLHGSPASLLIDDATHRAFVSYTDSDKIGVLDTASGALLRLVPARQDVEPFGVRVPPTVTPIQSEARPVVDRIDQLRRWVVVRVPERIDDEGPEAGSAQLTILDSRTGTRVRTLFTEPTWPDAAAVDNRRGRALSYTPSGISLYDISCLTSYYIFADVG